MSSKNSLLVLLVALAGCASNAEILHPTKSLDPGSTSIPVETKVSPITSALALKERIAKQYPDIENSQTSDWQKVNILRRWAYQNVDVGKGSCDLGSLLKPSFYQMSAAEIFPAFDRDLGGFLCGGTAVALVKLYEDYGFKAHYLAIGKVGYMTHAVTLVQIKDQAQTKFVIQDAFLNATYTHPNGSPLDYFELLSLLKQGDRNQVKVVQGNDGDRDYIFCQGNPLPPNNPLLEKKFGQSCVEIAGGKIKCRGRSLLGDVETHPTAPSTKKLLIASGYKPDFIYLFMLPFAINDVTHDRPELSKRAQAIIKGNASR